MSKYSAEEVRAIAKRLHDDITVADGDALMASDMLTAYAERIKADEGVVEATDAQVEAIIKSVHSGYGIDESSWSQLLVRAALESKTVAQPLPIGKNGDGVVSALSRVHMMVDSESEWADIDIADWQTIRAHPLSQEAEIERLRNVMAPKLRELHCDANGLRATLDGGACKALAESFAEQFNSSGAVNYLVVEFTTADGTGFVVTVQKRAKPTAHELRRLAESRLAAANAQLRLMHRVLSQAVCVACADDGSAKDHELDKLEGVLRDQGWITSAVVPTTPTDKHPQGAGDEAAN